MLTDQDIQKRFLKCLALVYLTDTQGSVADKLGVNQPYLSGLKKNKNPKIPSLVIAKFCIEYNYSPYYIFLGKGDPKATAPPTTEDKYLDLVGRLVDALLEVKVKWNDPIADLVNEAKKRRQ